MKMKLQHALLAFCLVFVMSCSKEAEEPIFSVAENVTAMEGELLDLVNAHRESVGESALIFSSIAYDYANAHTDYMIASGSLNHDNFTARASGISSKVAAKAVSENVARNHNTAAQALEGWLASDSHKKTMEGNFTHTAISIKKDAQGNLYYTQLFYLQ
ncbi:CAP domain-containing protein [Robiginitalea aurantiaca]|nr:CAP domain-containing protein [Robiginitalea aurantiaca]